MHYPRYYCAPPVWARKQRWFKPRATYDYDEDKNLYRFNIELPGIEKENIRIKASNNHLKIGTTYKDKDSGKEKVKYNRRFDFRRPIDTENINAIYKNGLLLIDVPLVEKLEFFDVSVE
ncbi:MAG: Hsp20/alpha crystallin family protein [Candidatus Heimdallarchaeota archaeon]